MLTTKQIADIALAMSQFPEAKEVWFDHITGETGDVLKEFAILKGPPNLEDMISGDILTTIDITDSSINWNITE